MHTNLTETEHAAGGYTVLALRLDGYMATHPEARAAYLATWGTEWSPLYATVPEAPKAPIVVTQLHIGTGVL